MKTIRRVNIWLIVLFALLMVVPFMKAPEVQAATTITVTSTSNNTPSYRWCQKLDGSWTTDSDLDGVVTAANDQNEPKKTLVKTSANLSAPTANWRDDQSKTYSYSEVIPSSIKPVNVSMHPGADPNIQGKPYIDAARKQVIIEGYSGKGVAGYPGSFCGSRPGMEYPFQMVVTWEGTVVLNSGTAHIKHFTESGQSLSSVFNDRDELLENGKSYSYTHPTNSKYTYVGYKFSTTSFPSGGSITSGDPPKFMYDTSYSDYYVNFYYRLVPTDPPANITGDFDITPSQNITFRDPFTLVPKNISDAGCTYLYHEYKFERDGSTFTTSKIYGKTISTSYSYSNYPWIIGVGSHTVSIRVTGTCGSSAWVPHPLDVKGPTNNNPPVFDVAWVKPGTQEPVTTAVVGDRLDLIYLTKPIAPYDPDGDPIEWLGFDLNSGTDFIKALPSKGTQYGDGWHNVVMDTEGFQFATGTMRDSWGASTSRTAYVNVMPPNPVPVISQSGTLKEDRRIRLDASASYSPYSSRSIDFNKTTWKIEPVPGQTQGTLQDIRYIGTLTGKIKDFAVSVKGQYKITLTVYDSTGLSGSTSQIIYVNPDLPPIPVLDGPTVALRDPISKFTLTDNSYSPDGDIITDRIWHVIYDANNDGVYDEPEIRIDINALVINQEKTFTVSGQTIKIKKISVNQYELRADNVGKINIRYELHETPGQPTSLEY